MPSSPLPSTFCLYHTGSNTQRSRLCSCTHLPDESHQNCNLIWEYNAFKKSIGNHQPITKKYTYKFYCFFLKKIQKTFFLSGWLMWVSILPFGPIPVYTVFVRYMVYRKPTLVHLNRVPQSPTPPPLKKLTLNDQNTRMGRTYFWWGKPV